MQSHSCHSFNSLRKSESIEVRGCGLVAVKDIEPWTIILSVKKEDVICYSNISNQFKEKFIFLKQSKFISKSTNIQRQLSHQNQVLMFYLIHLKNNTKINIFSQWFQRPLTAMYFFDKILLQTSQNYDLFINYVAEHNHMQDLCQFLFKTIPKQNILLLFAKKQVSFEQFKSNYEWSYFFINNRSFGYTNQYTLIPIFDMINHSSNNSNVNQMLSIQSQPKQQLLQKIVQNQQNAENDSSDNEEEQELHSVNHKAQYVLPHDNFYYHIFSIDKIMANQQILIQYGERNNQFLIQGYGFVEQFNKYDSLKIFVNPSSEDIYFDSVKGQSCKEYKFKRERFCFQLLIDLKKKYYEEFYHKDANKAKIIWSKPYDKTFEIFLFNKIISRMQNNQPKVHLFLDNLKGVRQMEMFQQERKSLFLRQIQYYQIVLDEITTKKKESCEKDIILPQNLREYYEYLKDI